MDSDPRPATVASDAVAGDHPAVSSSFRFHRPRGPMCGRGYCMQCKVATPDGRGLACETPAGAAAARRRDLLRPLGRVAEQFTPWFYERRMLRPRWLRRPALHAIRYLSAAGRLSPQLPPGGVRAFEELEVELVVVGGSSPDPAAFVVDPAAGDVVVGIYPQRTLALLRADRALLVHFQYLVVCTGSYDVLPPIPGNDLPGVIGLAGAERYGDAGALRRGLRVAVWAPAEDITRVRALVDRHGLDLVWAGDRAPTAIAGRRRVRAIALDGRRVPCDLFITAVRQPAIDVALQGGATAQLSDDGMLPVLVVTSTPDWMELTGEAARRSSGVPRVDAAARAMACLCEDVRVSDLRACVADGFAHPELVKRRTGAMTGPCQGKLCVATVLSTLQDMGVDASPTRSRPPARPTRLGDLAAHA
jgi:hypothetical protein